MLGGKNYLGVMEAFAMSTAILPFLGIIFGAVLQYFFTRHLENQKHHRELRTNACTDYIRAVSDQAIFRPQPQSQEGKEIRAKIADAKCRICLYGSTQVIRAFAQFERLGAEIRTPAQRAAFIQMVAPMRNDSVKGENVGEDDLEVILLGVRRDA